MKKSPKKQCKSFQHTREGKDDDVFRLCYGNYGNNKFFKKLPIEFIASSLLSVNNFFHESVKAMEANSGSDEAMKR
jgi:hypothetical protein